MDREAHCIRWSNGEVTILTRTKDGNGVLSAYVSEHTLCANEVYDLVDTVNEVTSHKR
jgi:hypothetical protein